MKNHVVAIPGGKTARVHHLRTVGNGVTGKCYWEITSIFILSTSEIEAIVEQEFPSAGYGTSLWNRMPPRNDLFVVEVASNASCD